MSNQHAMPVPATKRSWYRFGLRTIFIGITVAIILGYGVLYHVRWLKSRQQFLDTATPRHQATPKRAVRFQTGLGPTRTAPGLLPLFGEPGQITLVIEVDVDGSGNVSERGLEEVQQVKDLFPEADLMVFRKKGVPVWFMAQSGK